MQNTKKNNSNNKKNKKKTSISDTMGRGSPGSYIFGFFGYLNGFFCILHICDSQLRYLQCFFGICNIYYVKITYLQWFFGIVYINVTKYKKNIANMLVLHNIYIYIYIANTKKTLQIC